MNLNEYKKMEASQRAEVLAKDERYQYIVWDEPESAVDRWKIHTEYGSLIMTSDEDVVEELMKQYYDIHDRALTNACKGNTVRAIPWYIFAYGELLKVNKMLH